MRIQDRSPLAVAAMVRGTAWVVPDSGSPIRLGPGDVGIMRGPEPYLVADDPATAASDRHSSRASVAPQWTV